MRLGWLFPAFGLLVWALSTEGCGARTDPWGYEVGSAGASSSASSSVSSASSASSSSTGSGAGGTMITNGCADGTREGFVDEDQYPNIAACSGGWSVPGLLKAPVPSCGFAAGNSGPNPKGIGCSAADLCAPGFHVCKGADDVASRSPTGCGLLTEEPNLFFATRQGSTGCAICTLGTGTDPGFCNGCSCQSGCAQLDTTANDLFGCGTVGNFPAECGVLDRTSGNQCGALGFPWSCTGDDCGESLSVVKVDATGGGVLCCID